MPDIFESQLERRKSSTFDSPKLFSSVSYECSFTVIVPFHRLAHGNHCGLISHINNIKTRGVENTIVYSFFTKRVVKINQVTYHFRKINQSTPAFPGINR